jgi:hypothetical protein
MADLAREIAAFEGMQEALERDQAGKWVVVHGGTLAGVFDTFDAAAITAVARFGRGPYLIRQIGAQPVILPASVMYAFAHARD